MTIRKQNRRSTRHSGGSLNLQVPEELIGPIKELLSEMVAAKKKERDSAKSTSSTISQILSWIKDNATAIVTLITVVSALVTAIQFLAQQAKSDELQRQALIAQYSSSLSDKTKRNSAAYAFASVAGADAVPLLISELKQNALFESDPGYQNAISQALISIGKPALDAVVALNREEAGAPGGVDEDGKKVILAVQPIILYFLTNNIQAFQSPQIISLHQNGVKLEGLALQKAYLAYADFSGVVFDRVRLMDAGLCQAKFVNATFEDSYFADSGMGGTTLDGAKMTNTSFYSAEMEGATLTNVVVEDVNFSSAYLRLTDWSAATVDASDFSFANLEHATLSNGAFTNTDFRFVESGAADFTNSSLQNSDFSNSYLEQAKFNGADLAGVEFFWTADDTPNVLAEVTGQSLHTSGAFVRDADFSGAKNIDEQTRVYLCTWGALNVPGGCTGIQPKDTSAFHERITNGAGLCF